MNNPDLRESVPDGDSPSGNLVVEIRKTGAVTLRLEKVRCGKAGCKSCPHPKGGPGYWYAYFREGGKLRSKYIGTSRAAAERYAAEITEAGGRIGISAKG